jgi:aminomuconate-semialdehyde/2-hydroxymuconate-6-semialdehyde dehydrogenase
MTAILNFINGEYAAARDGETFPNVNPATGEIIGTVAHARRPEVDAAVASARSALRGPWSRLALAERCRLLHAVANRIDARFDEFVEAELLDTGKPYELVSHLDIPRGAANFRAFADVVTNSPTECFEMTTPDGRRSLNYSIRRPKGVIAVICPWNLPLLLMTWKVAAALACGNTVVVKPSEETPRTAAMLGDVMNEVGIPPGVFNVLHGFGPGSAGEYLTTHPDIDAITFTGETGTGEQILKAAARGIKSTSMELGGKNPAIVFADADLDVTIAGLKRSLFENSGQVCLGTERVYVERPIFEAVVDRLKQVAERLTPGSPRDMATTFGPLISAEHRDKVLHYYRLARDEGATVITGGDEMTMPGELKGGFWVQPTIWTSLPETATVIQQEIFGPCGHIAPFDTEDEVIPFANGTRYGLAASIYTANLDRAHRLAAQLEVGICWINSWFLRDLRTPFGGTKQSGIGREGGVHSLDFYSELRNVCVKL